MRFSIGEMPLRKLTSSIESREYPTKRHYRCAPNFGLHNEKLFSVENMLGKDKGFLNKSQKENEEHQEQEGREGREQSV